MRGGLASDEPMIEFIDLQQSNAMVVQRFPRKTGLPLVAPVALLI
jgi:hypothetical protein